MTGCARWEDADDAPVSEPVLTVEQADEKELARIDEEIAKLNRQRQAMVQRIASRTAIAQVDEVIEWQRGGSKLLNKPGRKYRGRVVRFKPFSYVDSDLSYQVRALRKDGSEGALVWVYPWDQPRKVEA